MIIFLALICISIGIIRPLKRLAAAAGHIADGRLDISVSVNTVDETGQVAQAIAKTVNRLKDYINYIQEISDALHEIANGNLAFTLQYEYTGEFAKIRSALEQISASLNHTILQINQAAEQAAGGADQVSCGAQALSQGATQQASSVEELAAAVGEISTQVKQTAENAMAACEKTEQTGGTVEASNRQMQEMVAAMTEISTKSAEISKIIKTIEYCFSDERSGSQCGSGSRPCRRIGQRFSVVADEVRNLASKSSEASKDTASLIDETVDAIEKGTQILNETAQSLAQAVENVSETVKMAEEISNAAAGQANTIAQVTLGVDQISSVVQTNSATAEESAAASEDLSGQAQMLKDLIGIFRLKENSRNKK